MKNQELFHLLLISKTSISTKPAEALNQYLITSQEIIVIAPSEASPKSKTSTVGHLLPSPLQTPHSSTTASPPHSPAQSSTLPSQSHAPSAIPSPLQTPHSSLQHHHHIHQHHLHYHHTTCHLQYHHHKHHIHHTHLHSHLDHHHHHIYRCTHLI